jgi:hypothetical protein
MLQALNLGTMLNLNTNSQFSAVFHRCKHSDMFCISTFFWTHDEKPHIKVKITYIEKDAQLSASVFGIQ